MKTFTAQKDYIAKENTVFSFNIGDLVDLNNFSLDYAWINVGGWQSWNPGFEVEPGKKQNSLKTFCAPVNAWNQYLVFPQSKFKPSRNLVLGQFCVYLRWDDFYLVFASVSNIRDCLPPVQFVINRKEKTVSVELYDKGKNWKNGDIQAKIEVFTCSSYFECKEKLAEIYNCGQFEQLNGLGKNPAGWESWYNHYANINEQLILEDLAALKSTENIISKGSYTSKIFQIDDGWELKLGDWDYREDRFPKGLDFLVNEIEKENYIPGLWVAPFIIDLRSSTALAHPDWLLRNKKGNLVKAGFNPLWGTFGNFYCLDLSKSEVITYLDSLMDKVINKWGFRYIKLDFLYAGMLYGNFTDKNASYEYYCKAIEVLTSRKNTNQGKPVFYLGCGIPFESSFKYFPLSRIGCDTFENWENAFSKKINWNGRNSAYLNLKDTLGHALWNKTIFANDPDVLFIRNENCSLTRDEKLLIAKADILFGSQLMYSDDPAKSTSESEKQLTDEILNFYEKYKDEEFGIKQTGSDLYEIFSKSGKYKGEINLGNEHYLKMF